ncbi:MAG TPA: hypothetical protein VLG50_08425 [Candidatus Saccharimonadales bacterium]|nr:hypothetical protein [Candidatus Saccharimonadales bacterium]
MSRPGLYSMGTCILSTTGFISLRTYKKSNRKPGAAVYSLVKGACFGIPLGIVLSPVFPVMLIAMCGCALYNKLSEVEKYYNSES